MKIRRNQLCPIHRSRSCCGREPIRKEKILQGGVRRIEDPHHPRGYRELRSLAEMEYWSYLETEGFTTIRLKLKIRFLN
jgi:hypothetical protein